MINRGATLISRLAILCAVLFAFTACGGGGGGGSSFYQGKDDNNNNTSSLSFTLLDPQGNATNTVTSSSPGTLRVTVNNGGANIVVSAETSIGTLFPATGTALTDSSGVATFQLEAGAENGAGSVTAKATPGTVEVSGTFNFQVGNSGLRLGRFDQDGTFIENQISIQPQDTLSAGGNAELSVVILNKDGERATTAEEVRFNSGCLASGQATANPVNPVKSTNGQASTLYTAKGCSGVDQITASLPGAGAQAFGTLTIASPQTNALRFVSATPKLIVLRGTGGQNRDETSDVIFTVVDGSGLPLSGVTVNFALSTYTGNLSLTPTSALSDGEGKVKVTVQAGDVATVVRVLATVDDGSNNPVSTVSDLLTVTTGLPDQNSISLAVDNRGFVIENGMVADGVTRDITVSMADKFNNPVVDGTAAVFTTEYGAIVGTCATIAGTCSVLWNSQEPRFPTLTGNTYVRTIFSPGYDCPEHNGNSGPCPSNLGYTNGGRSTILVTAIGEESFIDRNGNGVMDQDEQYLFQNLPEAFIDNNEDTFYTPADPSCLAAPTGSPKCIAGIEEIFTDFNNNQAYDRNDDPAVYNGLLCPPEGNGVWCSRELVNVRAKTVVILSDPTNWYTIMVRDGNVVDGTIHGKSQQVYISDIYNNRPPADSTVTVSAQGDCKILSEVSFKVANVATFGAYGIDVVTGPPDTPTGEPGIVNVKLSPIDGAPSTKLFDCGSSSATLDCDGFSPDDPGCPAP